MPTSLFRELGDFHMPVAAGSVVDGQLFSVFDPGADILLALFKSAINSELTAAWNVARVGTALASKSPVQDTLYQPPDKALLREARFEFPLLSLARGDCESNEHTLDQERIACLWSLDYIMGPLSPEDFRRLGATLNAVRAVVLEVIRMRGHPSYLGGALQFFAGRGHFASIRFANSKQGAATWGPEGEGQVVQLLSMQLETEEHEYQIDGADPDFAGVSMSLGMGGAAEGVLPDAIDVRTEFPPVIE